jgi:hypothetical protein
MLIAISDWLASFAMTVEGNRLLIVVLQNLLLLVNLGYRILLNERQAEGKDKK